MSVRREHGRDVRYNNLHTPQCDLMAMLGQTAFVLLCAMILFAVVGSFASGTENNQSTIEVIK